VVALVVRRDRGVTLSGDAISAFIAERLAAYKVPAQVFIQHDPLPRNASGKVLKSIIKNSLVR
jgi:long-chain acyl-CoA synthetase